MLDILYKSSRLTNKRPDDINLQLSDISRRVDETNKRIDSTNDRIDEARAELYERIENTRTELLNGVGRARAAIYNLNMRLDRLYDAVARRDEQEELRRRIERLETRIELKSAA